MAVTYHTDDHVNCEAPWECLGCGRSVCGRCDPSPGEQELCPECWWIEDPSTPGLDGVA